MESFNDVAHTFRSNGSPDSGEQSSAAASSARSEGTSPEPLGPNAAAAATVQNVTESESAAAGVGGGDDGGRSFAKDTDTGTSAARDTQSRRRERGSKDSNKEGDEEEEEEEDTADIEAESTPPPAFPQLSYDRRDSLTQYMFDDGEGGDEEPNVARSFDRTSSPSPLGAQRGDRSSREGHTAHPPGRLSEDGGIARMHKFSLYETATRYYLVGMDLLDQRFRMLKIDRSSDDELGVSEDDTVYSKKEMNRLLDAVDDGNKSSGGLKLRCSTWGLLGFIRFTGPYYMLLITKRSQAAMIGGHYVFQIDGTELVPLTAPGPAAKAQARAEKNADEARFVNIMNNIDLTRSFYFSYSYDITRTLQSNIAAEREALSRDQSQGQSQGQDQQPGRGGGNHPLHNHNSMFVWNHHLLNPAVACLKNVHDWCLPIIHGYVDQSALSIYGRLVYVTIIARRSRFFAGARFLKRGANDLGYVANDVETEQIVSEMLTTSFHAPGPKPYANPRYTSYVQHRGSIPLHWTQDNTGVSPKPNIELNLIDPFYSAAALHFNNLFERYGAPVYVLNLVKARERQPRESKLLQEYTNAVTYLNQFLPEDKKILYKAWDMSRAYKSHDQEVIESLENIAEDIIPKTGFFQNGDSAEKTAAGLKMQNGIARTNCIDCLDRTNAAQFVIGKRALGHQLRALRIIDTTSIEYDTDAINMFTDMWHDHGDRIAVQYGGSHLVNTMATYRNQNQWAGHSRDMVESFKRYYNNSFLDAQRQEAYNLFLGNYVFSQAQPILWDLTTDYYLHNSDPRMWSELNKHNYIEWYTPEFLKEREMPPVPLSSKNVERRPIKTLDDYWLEYYRPLALSSFSKVFSFKMKSTLRYLPFRSTQAGRYDLSPFVVRATNEPESRERRVPQRKGVTIQEPPDDATEDTGSITSRTESAPSAFPTLRNLPSPEQQQQSPQQPHSGIMKHTSIDAVGRSPETSSTPSKAQMSQWSIGQLVTESLNPNVSGSEAEEYERYINHPLKVPLVITSEEEDHTAAHLAQRARTVSSSSIHPATATPSSAAVKSGTKAHVPYRSRAVTTAAAAGGSDLREYANKCRLDDADLDGLAEDNMADYTEFLNVGEEGLTVVGEDHEKKRYKRYRQWLRGKSLFKQGVEV